MTAIDYLGSFFSGIGAFYASGFINGPGNHPNGLAFMTVIVTIIYLIFGGISYFTARDIGWSPFEIPEYVYQIVLYPFYIPFILLECVFKLPFLLPFLVTQKIIVGFFKLRTKDVMKVLQKSGKSGK